MTSDRPDPPGSPLPADSAERPSEPAAFHERALLDSLLAASPAGFAYIDSDFRLVRVNPALAGFVGMTVEHMLGRQVAEVVPTLWPQLEPLCHAVLAGGHAPASLEIAGRTPAQPGTLRHWLTHVYPVWPDGSAASAGIGIVALEITAQKHIEAALRASEERLRLAHGRFVAALEGSPVVVSAQDRDLRYTWVHNSTLGFRDEQALGATDAELFEQPADAARLTALKRRVLDTGQPAREEVPILGQGGPHWYDLAVRPQYAAGAVAGLVCAAINITDRKNAEERARNNELRLRLALDAARLTSFEWDIQRDRVRRFIAPDAPSTSPEDAPNHFGAVCRAVHPEDRLRFIAQIHAALTSADGGYENEFRILHPDGGSAWVYERGRVERDAAGRPVRLLGLSQDITERKCSEHALREADRRKDEFLAMLAHELRNPLAPIRNAVEILKRRGELSEVQIGGCHSIIQRQTEHLARLVDDLLDVSRISRGQIELRKGMFTLTDILQRALETSLPLIESRRHELSLHLPEAPLWVEGDLVRLAQVVSNLLNNAAKYTDIGGSIRLGVECADGHALIRVEDNGRGIDPAVLPHLFDLFYQVDRTLDRSEGGLGIGLSLVEKLVGMHGGQVEAHSAGRGRGSEFVVRLPCLHELLGVDMDAATQPGPIRKTGERLRILVVDDNFDAADSMALLLLGEGHEVLTAYDGETALDLALNHQPAVVLLDIGLPGMDGYSVARELRRRGAAPATQLVALTGYGQTEDREKSQLAGFDRHLVKPVDFDALQAVLAECSDRPA